MPEDELVDRCREWAEERSLEIVVVFDGTAPGGLVGERELDKRGIVVGTGREESADDWLIRTASRYAGEQRSYWLVTSDRALRNAAGAAAEKTIGGGRFLRELL